MISISTGGDEEWDKWYNPSDVDHERDNEVLYQLLKRGCNGDLEGRENEQLKLLMLEQSIEDRTKAQYRARHSIYPTENDKSQIHFSKYHIDFGFKEGEKCKVGVILKDKFRMSNKGSSKVSYSISNIPVHSNNIKLTFTPSSGTIKKNSALDIQVEMVVLCTTKVRELVAMDIANSGRHLLSIKIDSKMSQVLDYKELDIGNVIGGGGYGAIYKSKWRGLSVAVKVISEMSDGSEFEKELEMHKELLHHPNIVHFVGFCVSPKCLVLEFVEGGSLDKYLSDHINYPFTPELRLKMAYDIAKGMAFLHRSEILHLDLKPQNFLVVSLSLQAPVCIKLADFGLATTSTRSFYGATVEGSFLYMSPEVFTQKKFSRAADVWSYGACLIEILSGKRPYQEYDELGYLELARVREEALPPAIPSEITDVEMRKLIESCLHRDHTKRPSFEAIESFLEKKAEEVIKMSQTEQTGGSGSFLSGLGSGSSGHSALYSSSPQPASFLAHQPAPLLVSNNPNFGRKLPPTPGKPEQPTAAATQKTPAQKPVPPPRNMLARSTDTEVPIVNKMQRAMTDVSISETPRSETIPQRSVTISTPSQSFITPTNHSKEPINRLNNNNSNRPPTPALIQRPSTPIPKSSPKSSPNTSPYHPSNLVQYNNNNHHSPTSTTSTNTNHTNNNNKTNRNISSLQDVEDYYETSEEEEEEEEEQEEEQQQQQQQQNYTKQQKTIPIPIKTKNASTPQIQSLLNHRPPIRASSAVEFTRNGNQQQQASSAPSASSALQGSKGVVGDLIKQHSEPKNGGSSSSNLSKSDDSMDITKFSELRMRSLRVLKDLYISFTEIIRSFSDVTTLKQCIELGQHIRDFKKNVELLCIEHLHVGWDAINEHVKQLGKKSEIKNLISPPPHHFDGDTYNKVAQFRDAAVTVGESGLDQLFYLMAKLSPTVKDKPITASDKEVILQIAKITRAIKLHK
ncbi:protein kinase [Cavenderia fasciculata]|uniref:Protein kinase n=1 Tax=Cavenderia fasciculata TaxID=261658 RepID=F4PPU5_CACFS|nr:protein kinase [Cavenderia fasciculata]EGG22408.1 protein kinase [Cavenderia fasciculata]|eukprot:XP_004360259.1 protein kinase [Cavenderia fasciculata]